MYRLHSMHGPTVHAFDTLGAAIEELMRQLRSNGGLVRIIEDGQTRVLLSADTYATTTILAAEHNRGLS